MRNSHSESVETAHELCLTSLPGAEMTTLYRLAPPPPKNEAERILEVLEGLGRTPLGDARRGALASVSVAGPRM